MSEIEIVWAKDPLDKCKVKARTALHNFIHQGIAIPDEVKTDVFIYVSRRYSNNATLAADFLGFSVEKKVQESLRTNKKGLAVWDTNNIKIALRDRLGITCRLNEMSGEIEVTGAEKEGFSSWSDSLEDWIGVQLVEKHEFVKSGMDNECRKLLRLHAIERRYHPVKDYLNGLVWDGVPRIEEWLIKYAGAEDCVYTRSVSSIFLKAMVKRIYQPGAKFDELPVLVSPQGYQKGDALKTLVKNEKWYTDCLAIGSNVKETIEATQGMWLVEFSEIDKLSNKDQNELKRFLSRTTDKARPAYGRNRVIAPRQWAPVGTTNKPKFLVDETGNRRYWPIEVKCRFDIPGLASAVDQLWAEAKACIDRGDSIRLDPSLYETAANVQRNFETENPFYDLLSEILFNKYGKVTVNSIWEVVQVPLEKRDHFKHKLSQAMKDLGWERARETAGKQRPYVFTKEGSLKGWLIPRRYEDSNRWGLVYDEEKSEVPKRAYQGELTDAF